MFSGLVYLGCNGLETSENMENCQKNAKKGIRRITLTSYLNNN